MALKHNALQGYFKYWRCDFQSCLKADAPLSSRLIWRRCIAVMCCSAQTVLTVSQLMEQAAEERKMTNAWRKLWLQRNVGWASASAGSRGPLVLQLESVEESAHLLSVHYSIGHKFRHKNCWLDIVLNASVTFVISSSAFTFFGNK